MRQAGFTAAGSVTGTSVFRHALVASTPTRGDLTVTADGKNYDGRPATGAAELEALSVSVYAARDAAAARLTRQASMLGADGIVGAEMTLATPAWAHDPLELDLLELTMTGTAVRLRDTGHRDTGHRDTGHRDTGHRDDGLFVTGLSGQDFWTLAKSGFRPVGLLLGYCAYRAPVVYAERLGGNREVTSLARAVYAAREHAMRRMQDEAARLGAAGVVGIRFHDGIGPRHPATAVFFATGTAIAPVADAPVTASPGTVLGL